ncbi:MAG: ABC transporter substrate-binding protein [Rhizobiaceae bacterium]|nr:ABC transporter substrate-binding protein [Rhizobiaceae bacterium]
MKHALNRRSLLAATVFATTAFGITFPSAADEKAAAEILKGSGSVVVSTWGGSYVEAQTNVFFKPFTEATGIEVITTGTPDAAKLKLMEQSGNVEWDLLDAEGQMMMMAAKDDLIQKVDYDLIHKIAPADELLTETLNEYGFPSVAFGWALTWNTDKFKGDAAPKNWADFWDVEKFPGRRAVYANPRPLLEVALLADGVPRDKLYPLDVDRAFKKLDEIKPHIDVWVENTGQFDVLLQNSEVDLMLGSLGRSTIAKEKGLPFDYTMNDGLWQQSYWIVPKNAPNAENAMKLIAWMAQAENEAEFVKKYPYGMPNKKSYDLMSDEIKSKIPTSPANLATQAKIEPEWWTENLEAVNRRWLEWYSAR